MTMVNSLLIEGYATQKKATEEWREIPGYEGIYDASSWGRIRSAPGKTTYTWLRGERHWKERIMKLKLGGGKCREDYRVELWKDGEHKTWLVARLVAMAWYGVPEKGMTVNHKNGNSLDNRPENLEWMTRRENIIDGFRKGRYDSFQKPVVLEDEGGAEYYFPSRSSADRFLGKSNGYVSNRIQRGKNHVFSTEKELFFVKSA